MVFEFDESRHSIKSDLIHNSFKRIARKRLKRRSIGG